MVAVEHAGPEAYLPAQTPSGGLVAAIGQRLLGSGKEFVVAVGRDLVGGEQSIEVGDMSVVHIATVSVDEPLLQLLPAAYLHGRKLVEG